MRADQHVADPDGVRALALQRALVVDPAAGVRRVVVDVHLLLEVLSGVSEIHVRAFRSRRHCPARWVEGLTRTTPAAKRDDHVLQTSIAAYRGEVVREVKSVVVPFLNAHDCEVGRFADNDLDILGQVRVARVLENHEHALLNGRASITVCAARGPIPRAERVRVNSFASSPR